MSENADKDPEEASSDDPTQVRTYEEILHEEIETALAELTRPVRGLSFSGLSAGLDIGFSVLLMAVVHDLLVDQVPEGILEILMANMYSVGFIFVILGRSELFTEHTTLATLPVLAGKATLRQLARLWGLVYTFNLVGGTMFAAAVVFIAPRLGVAKHSTFGSIADRMVEHPWWVIVLSGVLAGWLMGLMSWLVKAGRDAISTVFVVWLVATSIGLAGLHHSIVGSVEVLTGVFCGLTSWMEFGRFLSGATLGNALGGVVFVAIVKYAHATSDDDSED